jgi:hypothetical protein
VVVMANLLRWTFLWVIRPMVRLAVDLVLYLWGGATWATVREAQGSATTHGACVGPKGQEPWSVEYVKNRVRGRSEQRQPLDLLVTDGSYVARLRHGALRGRTDRHGFNQDSDESNVCVHDCTHRYFHHKVEDLRAHLCASFPCTLPDPEEKFVHMTTSVAIDQGVVLDLFEVAHQGPWRRCFTVSWSLSLLSFETMRGCMRRACSCQRMSRRLCCPRRAPRPGRQEPQDPESETDSEAEAGEALRQAEQIAVCDAAGGLPRPLSRGPCKALCTTDDMIEMLDANVKVSCTEGLILEDGGWSFSACVAHTAAYGASRLKRACAVQGCRDSGRPDPKGILLCRLHSTKGEKPRRQSPLAAKKPETEKEGDSEFATKVQDLVEHLRKLTDAAAASSSPAKPRTLKPTPNLGRNLRRTRPGRTLQSSGRSALFWPRTSATSSTAGRTRMP